MQHLDPINPEPSGFPVPVPSLRCKGEPHADAVAFARFDIAHDWSDTSTASGRFYDPMPPDGRRHDPLRFGAHPFAGDRFAGDAGALPTRSDLRSGQPAGGKGEPLRAAALGLPADPQGRDRPIREDAGHGERERHGPVLPPASGGTRDLQATLGRWRAREENLPLRPEPDDEGLDAYLDGLLAVICTAAIVLVVVVGLGGAWWGGRP